MAEFQKYLSKFSYEEVQQILALFKRIEKEGYRRVRDALTKQ